MTDAAQLAGLVRAAQRGDGLAMAGLLDALTPAVGRWWGPIALQDADDAAQEAMIAILRGLQGLRGLRDPAALFGWARAIAVREAVRVARRAAREQPAELADLPAPGDPVLAADIADVLSRLGSGAPGGADAARPGKASTSAPPPRCLASRPAR